jgi:tetratricopeptide (TPR) repeat protein
MPAITARLTILLLLFLTTLTRPAGAAGDPTSYGAQAQELLSRGEYQKALEGLERGVALHPYDLALRRNLASAYAQAAQQELAQGRYAEAAHHFGQARDLSPGTAELGLLRGVALYWGKEYDAARAELTQAGEGATPLFFLGRVSYDTGDLPAALALWRRALELEPGDKTILGFIEKAERELPVESKMDKGYSSMFDLSFDAELPPGLSAEVLDALESAYNSVGADLGLFPTTRIPVLLYAKRDFTSVTAGPDWSGGLYDGKIRLPVGGVSSITAQMRAILFHEYTHVVIAELTGGNVPTWLNEGLAEIEGRREYSYPAPHFVKALQEGRLLSLSALSGSFAKMSGMEAGLAYQQSHSLAQFMVTRYGWYAVQEILKNLGQRLSIEAAVAKALVGWSLDLSGVIREWRESLPAVEQRSGHQAAPEQQVAPQAEQRSEHQAEPPEQPQVVPPEQPQVVPQLEQP